MNAHPDNTDYIVFFDSGHEPTLELLGGKCASLVSMTSAGMPVPPGFAMTTAAYDAFVTGTGLREKIKAALAEIDPDDVASIDRISAKIRAAIESRDVPDDMHGVFRASPAGAESTGPPRWWSNRHSSSSSPILSRTPPSAVMRSRQNRSYGVSQSISSAIGAPVTR